MNFGPEMIIVALWALALFFTGFWAVVALLVSLFVKNKARYYVTNALLILASINITLLLGVGLLPLPDSVKAKVGPSRQLRLSTASISLDLIEAQRIAEKNNSLLRAMTVMNYPLLSTDISFSSVKASLKDMAEHYPADATVQTANALYAQSLGERPDLIKPAQSSRFFRRVVLPVLSASQVGSEHQSAEPRQSGEKLSELKISSFEKFVNRRMPDGWLKKRALILVHRARGDIAYEKDVASASEREADRLSVLLLAYSLTTVLLGIVGAFVIYPFLVADGLWKRGKEAIFDAPPEVLSLRKTVAVLLISGYTVVIYSLIHPSITASLSHLISQSLLTLAGTLLGSLAMLLSMRWLVTSGGGTSVLDVLNLKMQKEAFLPALKNAFKGITITSFLFAIIWIVQFLSTGGIESKNLINVQMEAVIQRGNLPALTCTILAVVIFGPICEELLFRGLLYGWLRTRMSVVPAALISGFIFAIYHVDPQMVPGLWAVGFGLALVYERTRTLWGSIMMHSMWNLWYAIVCLFLR